MEWNPMVDWKIYIDSPQERALHPCGGSLTEGDGYSDSDGNGDGYGCGSGYGYSAGDGWGDGNYWSDGATDGWSEDKW
jgi:hypothetical protein